MTTKRVAVLTILVILGVIVPTFAQQAKIAATGPIVIQSSHHDAGPMLREVAPLLPEYSLPLQHEIPNNVNPNHNWSKKTVEKDMVLQTPENSPTTQTPAFSVEFEGISDDDSFCNCEPPDNDGAAGTTQYVQYINTGYEVFDKSGNTILGPVAGNAFWSGFTGSCSSDNWGDPVIRFDAAAQVWVVAQFDLGPGGSGPYAECVAVSQTSDATGAYNRYSFSFNDFPDYPKLSVWPDGYYFTFNDFNNQNAPVGANVCAADRSKMLTGAAATMICFLEPFPNFGMLPADLDGPNPPGAGTPNFVMELDPSGTALDMFQFHVDFTTPAHSTFTGPTVIPVADYTQLCATQSRGQCVLQPLAGSDLLESLGDRLMYRLVYRNFGDHTTLLTTHSVAAGASGGVRWYEIHNPETNPTIFQSGTFAPDSQYRWMPSIAMDGSQDIAIGFSRSGSAKGQYPSLVYAGRVPSDAPGTLESEVTLKLGLGSQTGDADRWGDYSSLTIDPADDCTFWFTEEYQAGNGGFNWHTAIGSFSFPGCVSGGTPSFSLTAKPNNLTLIQGTNGTSAITVNPFNGFSGSVTLSVIGLPDGVTAAFDQNPTSTTSNLTLTASSTATTGTVTLSIQGVSDTLTSSTSLTLTVNSSNNGAAVTLLPTALTWTNVGVGATSAAKLVTLTNSGTGTLTIGSITASGDFALGTSTKPCGSTLAVGKLCKIAVTFSPTQLGVRTGTLSILDNASDSPQTVPLSGTGEIPVALTPATATYARLAVGTSSAAKVFTLANHLSVPLTSVSISTTGDFSVSTTTCGTSVPALKSCTISVVFTPTQTGTRTGTLSISDSASNSPQTSTLKGTGH